MMHPIGLDLRSHISILRVKATLCNCVSRWLLIAATVTVNYNFIYTISKLRTRCLAFH